jgi:RES domain-containing protein
MPDLWRLYRAEHGPGLDGAGGLFADGRWHLRGAAIVYFGASAAIAVLERLAHIDADLFPRDLRLARFDLSGVTIETRTELALDWPRDQAWTRTIGDGWRRRGASCLLAVPSAILPEETNFVFNPAHPDANSLRAISERAFVFDARLL